jgi:hypothetical protein
MYKIGKFIIPLVLFVSPIEASAGLFDDLKAIKNKIEGATNNKNNSNNTSKSQSTVSSPSTSNNSLAIANSNKFINFICDSSPKSSIYNKLGKPDVALLIKDFNKNESQIRDLLKLSSKVNLPYLTTLDQYVQAFNSDEVSELFSNFVRSPNTRDLSIMASTMNSQSFDKKKKIIAADARFAYGLIHLFFHNVGGNKALGDKLIKEAAKKDQYGARFIEGLRWARGYGRSANLKNAASWMRPAYELSAKRDGDLAQIIENEFFNIVLHPNYVNRDIYVDLIQAAEEQRQSLEQQLSQGSGSVSHATLFKTDIYDLTIVRGQLLIELAEITNASVNIEKYKAVYAELANQANPSITTVTELLVVTDSFQNMLLTQLKKVEALESGVMPKVQELWTRTEKYVGEAYRVGIMFGIISIKAGGTDINNDFLKLSVEIGGMRAKACNLRQGIFDFSSRTNVELKPTNVAVNANILAPRKKKSR